jgi:hypothetical protein
MPPVPLIVRSVHPANPFGLLASRALVAATMEGTPNQA